MSILLNVRSNMYSSEQDVGRKLGILECRNVGVREKTQYFERLSQVSVEASFNEYLKKLALPTTSTPKMRDSVAAQWDEDTGLTPVREKSIKANTIANTNRTPAQIDSELRSSKRESHFGHHLMLSANEVSRHANDDFGVRKQRSATEKEKVVNVNVTVNIIAKSEYQPSNDLHNRPSSSMGKQQGGIASSNVITYVSAPKSKSASYDDLLSFSRQIEQAVQDAIQQTSQAEPVYAEPTSQHTSGSAQQSQHGWSNSTDSASFSRPILPPGVTQAQTNARGVVLRPNAASRLVGGQTQSTAANYNVQMSLAASGPSTSASAARMKRYSGDFRMTTPTIDERKLYQLKTAINSVFEQTGRRRTPLMLRPACFSADSGELDLSESDDADAFDIASSATAGAVNEFTREEKRRSRNLKKKRRAFLVDQPTEPYQHAPSTSEEVHLRPHGDRHNVSGVVARRIALARSINERTYATVERYRSMKYSSSPHLFEYACIVGIDAYDRTPRILYGYPNNMRIAQVEEFAFPDKNTVQPSAHLAGETYSFVMTREDGSRYFGFCRRCLPPAPTPRKAAFPEVFCLISSVGANFLYEQLLTEMERKRRVSWQFCCDFLEAAFECQMPRLGRNVQVHFSNPNGDPETVTFARPSDDRLEQLDLSYAFRLLGIEKTMRIYGALLLERRVILTSSRLSVLSAVTQTVLWLLYPFVWQHTFIPILPGCLVDVLDAPTPYMVGLLASSENMAALRDMQLDADVMLVDLDMRTIVRCAGDEARVLPKRMHKTLSTLIEQILARADLRAVANVAIFEAFMRMYVELFASLPDFFVSASQKLSAAAANDKPPRKTSKAAKTAAEPTRQPSAFANDLVFEKERFVKSIQSASARCFVAWFSETQQFAVLINDYLELNNAAGRKNSLAGTQANKFLNRLYEIRLNRRAAAPKMSTSADTPNNDSPASRSRRMAAAIASGSGVDATTRQQSSSSTSSSPFSNLAAKVKRAFLKQSSNAST